MIRAVVGYLVLVSVGAFAQPQSAPVFDVASIRAGQPGKELIEYVPGNLTMRNLRLTACIRWAYGVQEYQVSGPGWLNDVWFDISAKAAFPAKEGELRLML